MKKKPPYHFNLFNQKTTQIICEKILRPIQTEFMHECHSNQFYLNIPGIARFLALPEENKIIIEKVNPELDDRILNTWLLGTVLAYHLQYHGYLVLHGSAILMNNSAVIFSGPCGAGKSTLASSFLQQGYPLITDDLSVITLNNKNQYCILPGPAHIKLWRDGIHYFNYDVTNAHPIHQNIDKLLIPIKQTFQEDLIPIGAFYELNMAQDSAPHSCEPLSGIVALKIIMQNAYRYFMLKPLGKVQQFFNDCNALSKQISAYQLFRTKNFNDLPLIIKCIEANHGVT